MDGKFANWSMEKHLELAKKENLVSLFDWVLGVGFNSIVSLTDNLLIDLTHFHSSKIVVTALPSNRWNESVVFLFIEFTENENLFSIFVFKSKDVVSANAFHRPF